MEVYRMETIVAVYTGQGLDQPLKKIFDEELPECRLINIIDDSLINDVVNAGEVTPAVKKRLLQYFQHGVDMDASVILNTCSSVGEVADIAREIIDVPIVKIDEPMTHEVTENYSTIGVLATLPSTLNPTMRLLEKQAEKQDKNIKVVDGLAEGAFDALVEGKPEEHDRILFETAKQIADEVDVLVLAQGSMARMEKNLREQTGIPVLSSPYKGVMKVKESLSQN